MTEIEDLVRQALAQTPVTATTDPFVGLERRIRRARRWLAIGAGGAAAAVIAAIVVPVAVLSGSSNGGSPNRITVGHNPTPAPSVSNPPGVTTLWPGGAVSVAGLTGEQPWLLRNDHPGGTDYVTQVSSNGSNEGFIVQPPASQVVPGSNVVWVVGSDSNSNTGRISAIDLATGHVATKTFDGVELSDAVAAGDVLYVEAADASRVRVAKFEVRSGHVLGVSSIDVAEPGEIALSQKGHVWAQSGNKLVEFGAAGAAVDWTGDIYGPTGADSNGDDLWAYDGDRLIGLTPSNLQVGVSVAEGWRITVAGRPTAVATDSDGGLFVATGQKGNDQVTGTVNDLYYYAPQNVRGAGEPTGPVLHGADVVAMAADPNGGVDYVDSQGQLNHWDPTAGASAR